MGFLKTVFKGLKYVMYLAPLGAFGGMAYTIGKFGLHTLVPLAKLMSTMYLTMIVFIFVVKPILAQPDNDTAKCAKCGEALLKLAIFSRRPKTRSP